MTFPAARSTSEPMVRAFREADGSTVVQCTPYGLGRRADLLAVAAQASGVTVIAATGLHQLAHYRDPAVPEAVLPRLGALFVEELTVGMRPDPGTEGEVNPAGLLPRAGLIKVAGAFHHLDRHASHSLHAAPTSTT